MESQILEVIEEHEIHTVNDFVWEFNLDQSIIEKINNLVLDNDLSEEAAIMNILDSYLPLEPGDFWFVESLQENGDISPTYLILKLS